MNTLTADEKAFLEKMQQKRMKHNESQAKYRQKNKEKISQYNSKYQDDLRLKKVEINKKLLKAELPIPEPIDVEVFKKKEKIDKRTREGKKKASKPEVKPSFESRAEPLGYTTIEDYIRKADILNRLFNGRSLPQPVKAELRKLLNDNKNLDKSLIFDEMKFIIDDVDNTVNIIRQSYKNNSSFKSYINILAVITSHFKELNETYLIYTKLGKSANKEVQEVRENNELADEDKQKIIKVGEEEFNNNVGKLKRIEDILIYALYMLFPARRLDYRNMKITNEKNIDNLNDINYLVMDGKQFKFVFNDYKTYTTYKKQVFDVPEPLTNVIRKYIDMKQLKTSDFLISLERDKKEIISEGNFSGKISKIFDKLYNIPISVRYLRMSHASALYLKNPTIKEIKDLAFKMSHSPDESRLYNKIFAKN